MDYQHIMQLTTLQIVLLQLGITKWMLVVFFCGFPKAFDWVNHDILLQKLQYYGVQGTTLDWFKSYIIGTKG